MVNNFQDIVIHVCYTLNNPGSIQVFSPAGGEGRSCFQGAKWSECKPRVRAVTQSRRQQHVQVATAVYLNSQWDCLIIRSALSVMSLADDRHAASVLEEILSQAPRLEQILVAIRSVLLWSCSLNSSGGEIKLSEKRNIDREELSSTF